MNFINKFKIPTLLGLTIILVGLGSGMYLVFQEQTVLSKAAPSITPENITFTNINEDSISISWQTKSSTTSFVTYGQNNPGEQTALDDRDITSPKLHSIHYVTIKNLLPKTTYKFKIVSGKLISDVKTFQTAQPLVNQTGFTPIIGNILNNEDPLNDGVVYLIIQGAVTQSSLVKSGNFLIPISQIRKDDLSDIYPLTEGSIAKLTIQSESGNAGASFKLKTTSEPLSPIKLGQNLDLTTIIATPQPSPTSIDLEKYDMNKDGKINAADYTLVASCFNKNPKSNLSGGQSCAKADINGDGKIDQKDLDLISQELNKLGL